MQFLIILPCLRDEILTLCKFKMSQFFTCVQPFVAKRNELTAKSVQPNLKCFIYRHQASWGLRRLDEVHQFNMETTAEWKSRSTRWIRSEGRQPQHTRVSRLPIHDSEGAVAGIRRPRISLSCSFFIRVPEAKTLLVSPILSIQIRDLARLPTTLNRGSEPLTSSTSTYNSINKHEKKYKNTCG